MPRREGNPNAMLDAALAYARAGWPVFPVGAGGKRPIHAGGHNSATTDEAQIREWWGTTPDANIGMSPGHLALTVLDIDLPAGAETLAALEAEHGGVATERQVMTPRGGHHVYLTGATTSTAGRLGPGLDTRSTGGYVLLPPSRTDTGLYRWASRGEPGPVPSWMVERLRARPVAAATTVETDLPINVLRAEAWTRAQPAPIEGEQSDDATYRLAATLRDFGLSAGRAALLIGEHCPSFDPSWIGAKVAHAFAYAQNGEGAFAGEPSGTVFAQAIAALPPDARAPSRLAGPQAIGNLLAEPSQPVVEVVDAILEDGVTTLLSAPGDSFKSTFALQLALSVAAGAPVLRQDVLQRSTLYLSYEDGTAELRRRVARLTSTLALPADHPGAFAWDAKGADAGALFTVDAGGVHDGPMLAPLLDWLADARAHGQFTADGVVVLDSAYNVLRFGDRLRIDEDAVNAAVRALDLLATRARLALLLIYHPSRAGAARGDAGNSIAWDNAPRARLSLTRDDSQRSVVTLRVDKRNHAAGGQAWTCRYHAGALLLPSPGDARRAANAAVEAVKLAMQSGISLKPALRCPLWFLEVVGRNIGTTITDNELKAALQRAVVDGRVAYRRAAKAGEPAGYVLAGSKSGT